jgi:carbamate kinase
MTPPHPPDLVVVALGGNAVSPPRGDTSIATERERVDAAAEELAEIARGGARLLIVHGNGPQVGRLLSAPGLGSPDNLDVHVAQTQGELGYLLTESLDRRLGSGACVALVTRALVDLADPAFSKPTKPVGPILPQPPEGVPAVAVAGGGWRRVVASPRPLGIVELKPIGDLLGRHHIVAGGGGGIALSADTEPRRAAPAVIDKDWIAALLAIELDATELIFVTDVPHAFDAFRAPDESPIHQMSLTAAEARLAAGVFAPGSMGPKVESAVQFARAVHRSAVIATPGAVAAARRGEAGTTIGDVALS